MNKVVVILLVNYKIVIIIKTMIAKFIAIIVIMRIVIIVKIIKQVK